MYNPHIKFCKKNNKLINTRKIIEMKNKQIRRINRTLFLCFISIRTKNDNMI